MNFTGRVVWFQFKTGIVTIHADHDGELYDVNWSQVKGCVFNPKGRGGLGEVNLEDGLPVEFYL